ncbi:TraR/DksA C4-type zinc finger protein [Erwinia tracheiphila]|uniref:TraR/DksA family transcriptional regulator n=1 Tax=Erwinia tracheiphila TaxID=65700 RepID=A0A0M2KA61_9GAMM|nr:TraR/DksA C4-type zinc finger protein [Erwinia tracheiphila]AXF76834.1 TraR/DksA family transcriptional regulator [Erwinia tracheiphila]AXF78649.1 TraR/DksA family transcriptional regulator [Erwinia tracheiphila]EOS94167.1 hypothetical protein ETR_15201 [Erwinia tracheiphila PSU-1]KKF34113.1 hypothetical protein SY86_24065 [Erwinia tracheiphila]KKF35724.1 hypothetical protein SY86_10285 [Erwinia tracheiphila]
MADEADYASVLEQRTRDHIIAAHIGRPVLHGDGICIDCGEDIAPQRLTIDPGFTRCVRCQTLTEKREARLAGHD